MLDISTVAGADLGEVRIAATVGGTLRFGRLLGPLDGTTQGIEDPLSGFEAYLRVSGGTDLVLFDALVDGPLFESDPYAVTAAPVVPWAEVGVVVRATRWIELRYTLEYRGASAERLGNAPAGTAEPPGVYAGRAELAVWF